MAVLRWISGFGGNCGPALARILFLSLLVVGLACWPDGGRAAGTVGDDGLHKQSWFHESFLDLRDDLVEAQASKKGLIVAFEQAGCPYCREMHTVNFADAELVQYLRKHFVFVQLDIRGSREVVDFDGAAMEERKLARRWGIVFTPTMVLFAPRGAPAAGKTGKAVAAATMPGYFKPFHFHTMLEYVAVGHYRSKHFQAYVNERAERLRKAGKKVKIW